MLALLLLLLVMVHACNLHALFLPHHINPSLQVLSLCDTPTCPAISNPSNTPTWPTASMPSTPLQHTTPCTHTRCCCTLSNTDLLMR